MQIRNKCKFTAFIQMWKKHMQVLRGSSVASSTHARVDPMNLLLLMHRWS